MKPALRGILLALTVMTVVGCTMPLSLAPTSTPPASPLPQSTGTPGLSSDSALVFHSPTPPPTLTPVPAAIPTVTPTPLWNEAFALISRDSLFAFLKDLTAIQAHSGWREGGSEGEAEALDYVAGQIGQFKYLSDMGLELERQSFRVFSSTELWETRLILTVAGQEIEVPADGLCGRRDDLGLAIRFDSDGTLGDTDRNPAIAEGPVLVLRSADEVRTLKAADAEGKVIFFDYAAMDRMVMGGQQTAFWAAQDLLALKPVGLVLVTQNSNQVGESHGSFVGDSNPLTWVGVSPETPAVPTLYVRLEDLAVAGIADWDDLAGIERAHLTWDADVLAPGTSGNLVAFVPGVDSSQALILGAHIDSPNSPGAMDDGSGSVALIEVARVLDTVQIQPPVDLYLAWFGSEELGAYGSAHFAATHQDLLDRTVGMLQIDCLTHPLDGLDADLSLTTWSFGRLGDDRQPWSEHLAQAAGRCGVDARRATLYKIESDNAVFEGFGVPNVNLSYKSSAMETWNPIHYVAHIHDPYDTVDLAREVDYVLEDMTRMALAAIAEAGQADSTLRVAPSPVHRALFVGSHTESLHMAPTGFIDMGQTLAMEGFDVDLIPYGQPVTSADLEGADLVVVLPVVDLPVQGANLYDEAWSDEEIAALEGYVAAGGFLVLTNSAHRLMFGNSIKDYNEDWRDANALAERFGITYEFQELAYRLQFAARDSHLLVEGVSYVEVIPKNGLPIVMEESLEGRVLVQEDGKIVVGLVDYGEAGGQVLALADVGILGSVGEPQNLSFWRNLAEYALSR
jgi:hypothetical protein